MTRCLTLAAMTLALAGPASAAEDAAPTPAPQPAVISVSPDLSPLRAWFNENRGRPRLIVLLSPT